MMFLQWPALDIQLLTTACGVDGPDEMFSASRDPPYPAFRIRWENVRPSRLV